MRAELGRCALVIALLAIAACGSAAPSGSTRPSPFGDVSASPPSAAPTPLRSTPIASASPAADAPVHDPALLAVLPAAIDGIPVAEEPDSFAEAVTDPSFAANVASAAFGIAVDRSDLASGVVAQLKKGIFSDAFFRDWRDSYDRGACSQAGGVTGHGQAELGGRTVYITSCAGDLRTYHTVIPDRDLVVSLFSVGDRRFGEQLMAGLRP